ncbi:MAG: plastocyanin [Glaciecola sp.]|jgi:plastocyanin
MKTEFRNRAFLPLMMPLMIMAAMAAVIGIFSWILLYNTKDGALALATVIATGILVSIAFAAAGDELDARRKGAVLLALGVPVVAGMVLAGTGGGVEDSALLNINREVISVVPEINVLLVATNSSMFEQSRLTLPSDTEVAIVFDNEEVGVPHNVAYALAGPGGTAPDSLSPIGASSIVPGVSTSALTLDNAPGTYWFWCQVHSNMNGLLELAEGAEPAAS